jgi:hypothetical protein
VPDTAISQLADALGTVPAALYVLDDERVGLAPAG